MGWETHLFLQQTLPPVLPLPYFPRLNENQTQSENPPGHCLCYSLRDDIWGFVYRTGLRIRLAGTARFLTAVYPVLVYYLSYRVKNKVTTPIPTNTAALKLIQTSC